MRKKLFIPIFMLLLVIIGVGVNSISSQAQSKRSVLKIETNFDVSKEYDYEHVVSKKNRAILQNNNGQTATGKYAYITNDKKIRWDKTANYEYSPIVAEMIKQITLNGKSITIPTTIENLGRAYKEFSRVDYSKLKGVGEVLIKNTKNNYRFLAVYLDGSNMKPKIDVDPFVSINVMKDNEYLMNLNWIVKDKNIQKISTGTFPNSIGSADIRVEGIGVGNTFNEMYEKFGTPHSIYVSEDEIEVDYAYKDKSGNYYSIQFNHNNKFRNDYKFIIYDYLETKPNIITSVSIYYVKAK